MTWEHNKCLTSYSPQSHFWDCNITLNLPGGLGVWSGDWVSVIIKVWLCLSNSFTMCVLDSCWPLFIASETTSEYYEPELIIVWVCRPLIAKSCVVLKYVSSTNDDTDKSCVFEHGINRLRQIGSHMSPTFPFIETLYPILFG